MSLKRQQLRIAQSRRVLPIAARKNRQFWRVSGRYRVFVHASYLHRRREFAHTSANLSERASMVRTFKAFVFGTIASSIAVGFFAGPTGGAESSSGKDLHG